MLEFSVCSIIKFIIQLNVNAVNAEKIEDRPAETRPALTRSGCAFIPADFRAARAPFPSLK